MKVVLVMFRDGQRREFPIEGEEVVIGRRQDCGLRVQTGDVSRRHCMIEINANEVEIQDLESANGTFVNGKRVEQATLTAGDKVKVGPVTFVVQIDGEPENISAEHVGDSAVDLEDTDAPTTATRKTEPKSKKSSGDEDEDDVIMDLSEEDLFDTGDDDDDDPLTEMESILDDEDEDEPRKP